MCPKEKTIDVINQANLERKQSNNRKCVTIWEMMQTKDYWLKETSEWRWRFIRSEAILALRLSWEAVVFKTVKAQKVFHSEAEHLILKLVTHLFIFLKVHKEENKLLLVNKRAKIQLLPWAVVCWNIWIADPWILTHNLVTIQVVLAWILEVVPLLPFASNFERWVILKWSKWVKMNTKRLRWNFLKMLLSIRWTEVEK